MLLICVPAFRLVHRFWIGGTQAELRFHRAQWRTDWPQKQALSDCEEDSAGGRWPESKRALRIPRGALGDTEIEHLRAALSRASAKIEVELATSVDGNYLYVWRQD
jgi:hypothetical protein